LLCVPASKRLQERMGNRESREIGRVRTEKGSETQGGERKRAKEETQSGKRLRNRERESEREKDGRRHKEWKQERLYEKRIVINTKLNHSCFCS